MLVKNKAIGQTEAYQRLLEEDAAWQRRFAKYWVVFFACFVVTTIVGLSLRPKLEAGIGPKGVVMLVFLGLTFCAMVVSISVGVAYGVWSIRAVRRAFREYDAQIDADAASRPSVWE